MDDQWKLDLWEVIRFRRGDKCALIKKRHQRACFLSVSHPPEWREDQVQAQPQREGGHLQPKGGAFIRHQACRHLGLTPSPQNVGNKVLLLKALSL